MLDQSDLPLAPPYERYAPAYDASGQVRFALLVHTYLRELLTHHPVAGQRALDRACGTGTLALLLNHTGWQVTGVDASPAMLAQARAKLRSARRRDALTFVQADMRELAGAVPAGAFDLATCTYDSLNYLPTTDELAACFAGVATALTPGGLYVADMNTRHVLEYEWGACSVREQDGYVQIERSSFDATIAANTMLLTGFVGDDMTGYLRFDECHIEYCYPPELVTALLEAAGLHVEACYDSFTLSPPGPRAQRIFWVARKGA